MIEARCVTVEMNGLTLLPLVSFKVGRGEALIVTGKNGTGKSTLLRVLAGALRPSTGAASVEGLVVNSLDSSFRRQVAVMIGLPPFAPDLTVEEHILLVASTWFNKQQQRDEIVQQLLEELHLSGLRNRFPHELSTGQVQLFGLALVLARPFDILLLDEPEQRLDSDHIELVTETLSRRRDNGATLVVATHSSSLAENLGDTFLALGVT